MLPNDALIEMTLRGGNIQKDGQPRGRRRSTVRYHWPGDRGPGEI